MSAKVVSWSKETVDRACKWNEIEEAVKDIEIRWTWTLGYFRMAIGQVSVQAVVADVVRARLERGGNEFLVEGMPTRFTWGWS